MSVLPATSRPRDPVLVTRKRESVSTAVKYAILKSSKVAPRASIKDYFAIYLSFFKTDVFPLGVFSIRNFNGNAPRAELHKPARPRSP